jgi:hypothetical protein
MRSNEIVRPVRDMGAPAPCFRHEMRGLRYVRVGFPVVRPRVTASNPVRAR